MPTQTYTPIASQTLASATPTVSFTGISQAYTDLKVVINGGISQADANTFVRVGNSSVDTGSNYSATFVEGRVTTANSARFTSQTSMQLDYYGSISTTNSSLLLDFMNYSNTTTYKTVLSRYGNNTSTSYKGVGALVGLWRSTAAINIITFSLGGGNFNVGSTFTLYGIKAGS